jgi:two-component system chemotaxis sensor kinase CheA
MDDLLGDFLAETAESLDLVDVQLVKFEREPNNAEILDNIFRLVHTIKGTCGFLGLPRLESVAHAAETLMGRFREGTQVTQEAVSLVLASLDRIKEIMADLEATQHEPAGSDADLIDDLIRLASNDGSARAAAVVAPEPVIELPEPTKGDLHPGEQSLEDLDAAFAAAASDVPIPDPRVPAAEPDPEVIAESTSAEQAGGRDQARGDTELDVRAKSIRVNVDTIEKLMTTVSELVLARNQLLEIARHVQDGVLQAPLQRLSSVTAELQERVMKTRMQPIGNAWQKLPRIIRTLANDLDKKIELVMIGADTELDRQVLELIRDPLSHMIRIAADHGLEDT